MTTLVTTRLTTRVTFRVTTQVEPNDAMAVLAERFGTSIKHINLNNFDLAHSPPPGSQIEVRCPHSMLLFFFFIALKPRVG